jgi:hypothetical protein
MCEKSLGTLFKGKSSSGIGVLSAGAGENIWTLEG